MSSERRELSEARPAVRVLRRRTRQKTRRSELEPSALRAQAKLIANAAKTWIERVELQDFTQLGPGDVLEAKALELLRNLGAKNEDFMPEHRLSENTGSSPDATSLV
ncbi:hypothetical protein ACFWP0_12790 [Achromobacter sp. NPDC058515]|uniref:hypothetical protein n=1 Tax=Achromobacter sp. NPDC058515 TaxID=3346533 RepID=UPI00365B63BE